MKAILLLPSILLFACSESETKETQHPLIELIQNNQEPVCPEGNHTDSIIPIKYGYPSEEMWAQSDSGLIVIGGCEIEDYNHYCKIHEISFE